MRRFENYWLEEARWEEEQNLRRRERRKRTREERRARERNKLIVLTLLALLLCAAFMVVTYRYAEALDREDFAATTQNLSYGRLPGDDVPATERCYLTEDEVQEDFENEKIEAELVEMGYFRDDVPLDYETQAYLRTACDESGVPFEMALAVIRKESTYQNITGDSGDSIGYMQVQPKWHQERMRRLGVTDLTQPLANFRVGCDYLAELMDKYSWEEALTAYNSGKPGKSDYADTVLKYWRELS